jgi:hypothetical protein
VLNLKRATLKQQLDSPELLLDSCWELKAIEMVINEYVHLFDLYEYEKIEAVLENTKERGLSISTNHEPQNNDEKDKN